MKICAKCNRELEESEFPKDKNRKDGLFQRCKYCKSEYDQQHYRKTREQKISDQREYYSRNKAEVLAKQKVYNKTNHEKIAERQRKYVSCHREKYREIGRRWRVCHPEKVLENTRKQRRRNPKKSVLQTVLRRARQKGATGKVTVSEIETMFFKYGYRCLACGATEKLTVDHIVPITKGGSLSMENLQPLCHSCNSKKHTKTIDYRPQA